MKQKMKFRVFWGIVAGIVILSMVMSTLAFGY